MVGNVQVSLRDSLRRHGRSDHAAAGSMSALIGCVALLGVWGLTGPIFNFSDVWQFAIDTTTTVITFSALFVIRYSADRQGRGGAEVGMRGDSDATDHRSAGRRRTTANQFARGQTTASFLIPYDPRP